jgi:coenzyme F420-reducing hydrogenase delta subunit
VVVACCAQISGSVARRITESGGRIHPVSCVGNLHSSVVELMLRQGAAGVMVAGCPPRDCVGREGPKWLGERFYNDRDADLQPRVDRRRIRVVTAAAGLDDVTVAAFEEFRREVLALDAPDVEQSVELDALCDVEPTEAPA